MASTMSVSRATTGRNGNHLLKLLKMKVAVMHRLEDEVRVGFTVRLNFIAGSTFMVGQ